MGSVKRMLILVGCAGAAVSLLATVLAFNPRPRSCWQEGDGLVVRFTDVGDGQWTVVLPPGKWTADDGVEQSGPQTITVTTPLDRLPHFVRTVR